MIKIKSYGDFSLIKSAANYSQEELDQLLSFYQPGSPYYDMLIDRLYFHDPHDKRDWSSRTDATGHTIIPGRQFYCSARTPIPLRDLSC